MRVGSIILFALILVSGCVQLPSKPLGCTYDNPPCVADYECINNTCILKPGCQYNNPSCDQNHSCINNTCILKSGCQYNNPPCDENRTCINNNCVLKKGCSYNNPPCGEGYKCKKNKCVEIPYCLNDKCKGRKLDFVIITRPMFVNTSYDFAEWKKERFNFSTGILTLEYIVKNYEGEDMSKQIQNAIHQTRLTSGPKFFLIVGDAFVPVSKYSEFKHMYTLEKPWNIPTNFVYNNNYPEYTDLIYADADNWPTESDGHIHIYQPDKTGTEIFKFNAALRFEAYVGRWPVRNNSELKTVIEKNKKLKPTTKILILKDSTLQPKDICPKWPVSEDVGFEGLTSTEIDNLHYCYSHIPNSVAKAINGTDIELEYYSIDTMKSEDLEFAINKFLNTNYSVIESFHGYYQGVTFIDSDDLDNMTQIFPLFDISSCMAYKFHADVSGMFGDPDVFSEESLKHEKGSVIVVSGANHYYFYKRLSEGKTVGEAFYGFDHGMISSPGTFKNIGAGVLLGDPSLVIFEKNISN